MTNRPTLIYWTRVSIRYHRSRERFYRIMDNLGKGVSIIAIASFGSSLIGDLVAGAIGILSLAFTIGSIVLDFAGLAGKHAALTERYLDLLAAMQSTPEDDTAKLPEHITQYHAIGKAEPPSLRGLTQLCQDEQDLADGRRDVESERTNLRRRFAAQFGFGERPPPDSAE